jgi:polyhydroxyalkanoate synthesis regulator protein
MADPAAFAKLVPGFDFLQGLIRNAGSGLPGMSQWIAPTLDPEELEKRIRDLRTVQFWLEQNAKMIGATVQALEVQRMTLATLKTMNVPVDAMRESMKMRPPQSAEPAVEPAAAPATPVAPTADPMQWWTALTQQFGELAANAMKELPTPAAAPQAAAAPAKKAAAAKRRPR